MEKMNLLICDDEWMIRESIVQTALSMEEFNVFTAVTGRTALELLEEEEIDGVVLDMQMPEMDGYQATEMIRNLGDSRAAVPIVAMTANAFEEDRQKALDAGMNAHVSKPVDMNVLFRVMAKFI